MKLISIESARATQVEGVLILQLKVDIGQGRTEVIPVTYDPNSLTPITSEVQAWMEANPGLYVHPLADA